MTSQYSILTKMQTNDQKKKKGSKEINLAVQCLYGEISLNFGYLIYRLKIAYDIPFLLCNQKTKCNLKYLADASDMCKI